MPTGSLTDFLVPKVINNTVVKIVETHHHYEPGSSSTNASEIGKSPIREQMCLSREFLKDSLVCLETHFQYEFSILGRFGQGVAWKNYLFNFDSIFGDFLNFFSTIRVIQKSKECSKKLN